MVAVTCSSRFDSRDLTILSLIQTAQFSHQAPNGYRANVGAGDFITFQGYGFVYHGGRPYQGTTTTLTVYEDNHVSYQATGLSITIAEFIKYSHMSTRQFSEEIFEGNDVFVGSDQPDYLEGFDGNDTYVIKNAGVRIIEKAGGGNDTVRVDFSDAASGSPRDGEALGNFSFTLANTSLIENLLANISGSTYALDLTGNKMANTIKGNAGSNDIDGGGGRDVLWGGKGRDAFVFELALTPGNRDIVKDFNAGGAPDAFKLSRSVFQELDGPRLDASEFKVLRPGNTVDGNDHILYNRTSGWLYYDPDGQGGVAAKAFALVDNHAALTYDDFLLIA